MTEERITLLVRTMKDGRLVEVEGLPHLWFLPGADYAAVRKALTDAGFQPIGRGETIEPD